MLKATNWLQLFADDEDDKKDDEQKEDNNPDSGDKKDEEEDMPAWAIRMQEQMDKLQNSGGDHQNRQTQKIPSTKPPKKESQSKEELKDDQQQQTTTTEPSPLKAFWSWLM